MERSPDEESVDQTLMTSVERVKTSRELLRVLDERLARGAEMLSGEVPACASTPAGGLIDLHDGDHDGDDDRRS